MTLHIVLEKRDYLQCNDGGEVRTQYACMALPYA